MQIDGSGYTISIKDLDDLLVLSFLTTFDKHLTHLTAVLSHLLNAGLTINVVESRFALSRVEYLEYVVGNSILKPINDKARAISDHPVPATQKQFRWLLGMTGWYQWFIPKTSTIVFPHTELLKGKALTWDEETQNYFQAIKDKLYSSPV